MDDPEFVIRASELSLLGLVAGGWVSREEATRQLLHREWKPADVVDLLDCVDFVFLREDAI